MSATPGGPPRAPGGRRRPKPKAHICDLEATKVLEHGAKMVCAICGAIEYMRIGSNGVAFFRRAK